SPTPRARTGALPTITPCPFDNVFGTLMSSILDGGTMHQPGRHPHGSRFLRFQVPLFVLCCSAMAGCGGGPPILHCTPSCPPGSHCAEDGCVDDDPNASPDLAVPAGGDMAPSCAQPCATPTPYCGPNRYCVACLEDSHCPQGMICKPVGNSTTC